MRPQDLLLLLHNKGVPNVIQTITGTALREITVTPYQGTVTNISNLFLSWNFRDSTTYPNGTDFCDMDDAGVTVVVEPLNAAFQSADNKTFVEASWDVNSGVLEFGTGTNNTSSAAHIRPYGKGDSPRTGWALAGDSLDGVFDGVRIWVWGDCSLSAGTSVSNNFLIAIDDDGGSNEIKMFIDEGSGSVWKGQAGTTATATVTNVGTGAYCALMDYDSVANTCNFYIQNATASADWDMPTANKKVAFTSVADTPMLGVCLFAGGSAAGVQHKIYYLAIEFRVPGNAWTYLKGQQDPPAAV